MLLFIVSIVSAFAGSLDYKVCSLESIRKDHVEYSDVLKVEAYKSKDIEIFEGQKQYFAVYGEKGHGEFGNWHVMNLEVVNTGDSIEVLPGKTLGFTADTSGASQGQYTFENFAAYGSITCERKVAQAAFVSNNYKSLKVTLPGLYQEGEYNAPSCFLGSQDAAAVVVRNALSREGVIESEKVKSNTLTFSLTKQICIADLPGTRESCIVGPIKVKVQVSRCQ